MSLMLAVTTTSCLYFCWPDINECNSTDKGGCDHNCSNTLGSYNCSCNEGFVMLGENNTCIGKSRGLRLY